MILPSRLPARLGRSTQRSAPPKPLRDFVKYGHQQRWLGPWIEDNWRRRRVLMLCPCGFVTFCDGSPPTWKSSNVVSDCEWHGILSVSLIACACCSNLEQAIKNIRKYSRRIKTKWQPIFHVFESYITLILCLYNFDSLILCKLWMIFRCIFGASLGGSGLSGVTVSHRKDRVHRVYCCSDGASKCSFGTVSGFTWVAAGCIHAVEIQISMHSRIPQSHSKVGRCEASLVGPPRSRLSLTRNPKGSRSFCMLLLLRIIGYNAMSLFVGAHLKRSTRMDGVAECLHIWIEIVLGWF